MTLSSMAASPLWLSAFTAHFPTWDKWPGGVCSVFLPFGRGWECGGSCREQVMMIVFCCPWMSLSRAVKCALGESVGSLHLVLACILIKGFLYYRVLKDSLFKHTWWEGLDWLYNCVREPHMLGSPVMEEEGWETVGNKRKGGFLP